MAEVQELIDTRPEHKRTWMIFSHTHKGQVGSLSPWCQSVMLRVDIQYASTFCFPGRRQEPDLDRPRAAHKAHGDRGTETRSRFWMVRWR